MSLPSPQARKIEPAHARPQRDGTMKALVWKGVGKVAVEEVPRRAIGAIVRVTATTMCGSPAPLPWLHPGHGKGDILGHECMGIADEVGDDVTNVRVGDRVVVSAVSPTGRAGSAAGALQRLRRHQPQRPLGEDVRNHDLCPWHLRLFALTGGYPGGQAEYIAEPFADVNTLNVPEAVPDEKALFLSDIVSTGWHATELGRVQGGEAVAGDLCGGPITRVKVEHAAAPAALVDAVLAAVGV